MADEIARRDFTPREAREAVARAKEGLGLDRDRFLELFERNAHKALGYGDFSHMMIEEFGAVIQPQTVRYWLVWARVEHEVLPANDEILLDTPNKASTSSSTDSSTRTRLTYHEAIQLARLPEGQRKEAYDECWNLTEHGKAYRPKDFLSNLKHIVNRRLKAIAPPPAEETSKSNGTEPTVVEPVSTTDSAEETQPATTLTLEEETPPPAFTEPEEAEDDGPDWNSWEEVGNTFLTWAENHNIDGDRACRAYVADILESAIKIIREEG